MCGFLGVFNKKNKVERSEFISWLKSIENRGPDSMNTWTNVNSNYWLGHCRLSILDLQNRSNQPMLTDDGRYILVYNGEVYNFEDIKKQLIAQGVMFETHSDTEVVLKSIIKWGIEFALNQFIGMFAFALYDLNEHVFYMARDRVGIKPLFYYYDDKYIQFASQLSPFLLNATISKKINSDALEYYLSHMYVSDSESILADIHKVQPGEYIKVYLEPRIKVQTKKYWQLKPGKTIADYDVAKIELQTLLNDSVRLRMKSDVPYGAFLSGGVDSSLVASIMQSNSSKPINTFSIGFSDQKYNEAKYAKEIANHLGTQHQEIYLTDREALDVIPDLPTIFDEPFADSSQIPTYFVSKMAREHVKVALSGDGGDELFAGYNRYMWTHQLTSVMNKLPYNVKRTVKRFILNFSESSWDSFYQLASAILPYRAKFNLFGNKMYKVAHLLDCESLEECYQSLTTVNQTRVTNRTLNYSKSISGLSFDSVLKMQELDFKNYLPGDILTKVDRASMAVSLEARVPLLDHRIAEVAWGMPQYFKLQKNRSKVILRDILNEYVPQDLIDRPKMGFGVPLHDWLYIGLKDWAMELLNTSEAEQLANFDVNIEKLRQTFYKPEKHHTDPHYAWTIMMYIAWAKHWKVYL